MKKKYLLLIPILFILSFAVRVYALGSGLDYTVVFEHDVDSKFKNFTCSDGKYFSVSKNAAGDYVASWNYAATAPEGGGEDTIKCSYDEKYGESGKGTVDYTITFTTNPGTIAIFQDLTYSNPKLDIVELLTNYSYTKSINFNYDSNILNVFCPVNENKCTFEAKKFDTDYEVQGTLIYVDGEDKSFEVEFTIRVHKAVAYASPGGYGVCKFDSNWKSVSSEVIGGYDGQLLQNTSSNVVLPECDASTTSYPLLKFSGWIEANYLTAAFSHDIDYRLTAGGCSSLPGYKKGGNITVNPDGVSNYYYACYDYEAGIELVPNGGTLKDASGWTYTNGVYIKPGSGTLPDVNPGEGYEFIGWKEQGTGVTFKAGDEITVEENSSLRAFTAMYERTDTSSTYSYDITMVKGKTEELGTLIGDKMAFESCSSTNSSIVAANYSGGECIITAVDPGTATIKAEVKGDTYIIGVKVYATQEELDADTEIEDEDPGDDEGSDGDPTGLQSIGSESVCKNYTVTADDRVDSIGSMSGYNYGFYFNIYKATSDCDDKKVFYALCLDPGQAGPDEKYSGSRGNSYVYSKSLDFVNNKLDAGLYNLVSRIAGDGLDKDKYAAVNLAGRVLEFVYGYENNGSLVYKSHHLAYKALANKSKDGTLGDLDTITNSTIFNLGKEYYAEAFKASYTEEDREELEVQVKDSKVTGEWSGKTLTIHNTGTLILPKGSSNAKLVANCSLAGYSCDVKKFSATGSTGLTYDYEVTATITVTSTLEVPDADSMEKVSFKLSFDNSNSAGNAFVITHKNYANHYQRMILVNPGQNEYLLYLQWPTDSSLCDITIDELNPDLCTESDCSKLNKELFWKLKCCTKISDKTSYAYQYLCFGGDCTYNNLLPVCVYDAAEESSTANDMFQINEAKDSGGSYKYSCIVAIDRHCTKNSATCSEETKRSVTDTKKDLAGNKFSLDDYSGNKYCRVSCKEDWNFSLSKFGNFTKLNAVEAGSYFQIKNDVFMGGSRTCVTTKIDYEQYQKDQEKLAKQVVADWNKYSQYRGEYSTVKDESKTKCVDYNESYYDSSKGSKHCHTPGTCSDGTTSCSCPGTVEDDQYGTSSCVEHKIDSASFKAKKFTDPGVGSDASYTSRADKTTNTTVGTDHNPGSCSTDQTCETLRAKMLDEIASDVDTYRNKVEDSLDKIKTNAFDFSMCQNFELYTKIPSNGSSTGFEVFADTTAIEKAYGDGVVYTNNNGANIVSFDNMDAHTIDTVFGPFAKYTYEETEYMKLIEPDNYMIPFDVSNNKAFDPNYKTGDPDHYANAENECGSVVVGQDDQGNDIKVCRHYYTTQGFKSAGEDDTENSIYGNEPTEADNKKSLKDEKDSFGTNVVSLCNTKDGYEYTDFGDCKTATFYYYKINYIKQVLTNSSYWRNKMQFYENQTTSEKKFAASITDLGGNTDDWTLYGGYNIFPISTDRRRNLYQYSYIFYNIGQYSDGKLGRIMGGEVDAYGREVQNGHSTHLIENNAHACFYEVYESICRCCGEKIVSTVVLVSGVTTTDYIADNGKFYTESDYVKISDDSALGLYTSTVSLSNLASSTQRVLGANWKAQTPFYLSGTLYSGENGTNQGAELINQIQGMADAVYNKTPDYSFTLNPSALSEIRNYNKNNQYGVPKKLKNYGNYGYTNDGSGWLVSESQADYRIRFTHYGSDYLESLNRDNLTTEKYRGKTLLDITGANTVCLVEEGNVSAIYNSEQYKYCRWVDYLTTITDENGNEVQVRLAFK